MKRAIFHLAVLAAFLFSASTAWAGPNVCNLGTLLSAVAMNGAAGTRTISLGPVATCYPSSDTTDTQTARVAAYKYLVLIFDLTTDESTALVATHLVGLSTATATPGQCSSTSGGTCTSEGAGVTSIGLSGASLIRAHRYNIRGYPVHSIVMSESSADAADLLTVTGYLVQ